MPTPKEGENQEEFVSRCVPVVIEDQELDADSEEERNQAVAICHSMWRQAKEAVSLDERGRQVRDAWRAQFDKPSTEITPSGELWPKEVFDDSIIIESPEGLLSYPYTVNDAGEIEFGEPTKVEVSYQKKSECLNVVIVPRYSEGKAEFEGREWDITIIGAKGPEDVVEADGRTFIRSRNNRLYDVEALKESTPRWEGVKVYDNHLTGEEFKDKAGMRSVASEWIGSIVSPKWKDGKLPELKGILKVVEETVARKLKNAWDQGILGTVGLSIDTLSIGGQEAEIEGQRLPVVEGFEKILSVDLVAEPAAGGGFNRLIAAKQYQEATQMDKEQLKTLVQELVTEALAERKVEDEQREALIEAVLGVAEQFAEAEDPKAAIEPLVKAMILVEAEKAEPPQKEEPEEEAEPQEEAEPASDVVTMEEHRKLECKVLLRDKLDAAKLQGPMREMVQGLFEGKIYEEADLDKAIKRAKEAQAASDDSGRVKGAGETVKMGMDEQDKLEVAFLRHVMGYTDFRALESAEDNFVKERISEAYHSWVKTGRQNIQARGLDHWLWELCKGDPLDRVYEATTTTSMSSIVKNALNVMLAADYAKRQRWWDPIVRIEEVDTIDQATLVRVFGLGTLSVVNEGAAYTEMTWADEEETAAFVKRGNFVGVTLEAMLRDKVAAIRTLPTRLATSWHNTISALVSNVFTINTNVGPTLADTGALFNATAVTTATGHANLLTAALSFTSYGAARTAMMKQTDQPLGAGQRLLIQPAYMVVPVDLETTALQVRNTEYLPGSANNDVNPYYQKFEVVVNPHETDTNNWALVADPQEFPAIWLIFLRGRRVPEIYTAGDETSGAMFTNDTLRYKVRMLSYRFSATDDCAPVSDFRPLHKSNV